MKKPERIYLDFAATTPADPLVVSAMLPFFSSKFGNPSSIHQKGQESLQAVDQSREKVAKLLNCSAGEVIFTSGATESNNLAIRGVISKYRNYVENPEIITTRIEHPSVLNTCLDLEKQGIRVKYLPVNAKGVADISALSRMITDSTALVTVIYANNEIGTIQPIREIGKLLAKINQNRTNPIVFHSDAVQAVGTLNCNVQYLHLDLLSLSGHKIYGPKGVGALYVRKNLPFEGIQKGGDQEYALRAGTLPVPLIVGFGVAASLSQKRCELDRSKMEKIRDRAYKKIKDTLPDVILAGDMGEAILVNYMHLRVAGIPGDDIMFLLDTKYGIEISTGSACSAGAPEASKVLLAMGLDEKKSREGIRVSIGRTTTSREMDRFVRAYCESVNKLRGNSTETG
jgi:cysteine desulfurase